MQNLDNKKTKGKNENLNLQIKYLKETKNKLDQKIASLKDVNKRQSEILKSSTLKGENTVSISAFESRKSNKNSGFKGGKKKYYTEVGRRVITNKKQTVSYTHLTLPTTPYV